MHFRDAGVCFHSFIHTYLVLSAEERVPPAGCGIGREYDKKWILMKGKFKVNVKGKMSKNVSFP